MAAFFTVSVSVPNIEIFYFFFLTFIIRRRNKNHRTDKLSVVPVKRVKRIYAFTDRFLRIIELPPPPIIGQ